MTTEHAKTRWIQVTMKMPLSEVVTDFYDRLKDATSGYARYV